MSAADVVLAEYSKTNRSRCKSCQELIDKGELRIGVAINKMLGFYHLDCFKVRKRWSGKPIN